MLLLKLILRGPGIFLNQTISDGLKDKIVVFHFFFSLNSEREICVFSGNNAILRKVTIVFLAENYTYRLVWILTSNRETFSFM